MNSPAMVEAQCSSQVGLERYQAMLLVVTACSDDVEDPPKPSDVHRAVEVITTAAGQKHELSQAFAQFGMGQAFMARGLEIVERSSEDMVGDAALEFAQEKTRTLFQGVEGELDVARMTQSMSEVPGILSKFHTAVSSWSSIRLEEQWSQVQQGVTELASACYSGASLSINLVVGGCKLAASGMCIDFAMERKDDDEQGQRLAKWMSHAPGLNRDEIAKQLAPTLEPMCQAAVAHTSLSKTLLRVVRLLGDFVRRLPTLCKTLSDEALDFTDTTGLLDLMVECCSAMSSVLLGNLYGMRIVVHGGGDFKTGAHAMEPEVSKAVDRFEMVFPVGPTDLDIGLFEKLEVGQCNSFIFNALAFCRCRSFAANVKKEAEWLNEEALAISPELAQALGALNFFVESQFGEHIFNHWCMDFLDDALGHVVRQLRLGDLRAVHEESMKEASLQSAYGFLVAGDLRSLSS